MANRGVITHDNIQERIQDTILQWRDSAEKPPYSIEQLVVMAVLYSQTGLSEKDIFTWICDKFQFYRRAVSYGFYEHNITDDNYAVEDRDFMTSKELIRSINGAVRIVELPFKKAVGFGWSIALYDGLPLIQNLLDDAPINGEQSQKSFNFFGLPTELRNVIYEMTFSYSNQGSGIVHRRLPSKDMDEPAQYRLYTAEIHDHDSTINLYESRKLTNMRPYSKILAPLLTCRQFYQEAMPTFYRINYFRTDDLHELYALLQYMAPERRKHICHVTSAYRRTDTSIAPKTFKLLGESEHLHTLNLRIDEDHWRETKNHRSFIRGRNPNKRDQFKEVVDGFEMPGMATLRALRGLEVVNVKGTSEDVTNAITEDLLKPRGTPKTKKRRAQGNETDASKGSGPKKAKKGRRGAEGWRDFLNSR